MKDWLKKQAREWWAYLAKLAAIIILSLLVGFGLVLGGVTAIAMLAQETSLHQ